MQLMVSIKSNFKLFQQLSHHEEVCSYFAWHTIYSAATRQPTCSASATGYNKYDSAQRGHSPQSSAIPCSSSCTRC
eukprot:m.114288 g.114288  ORF g.114288 m.114288 type:complete len:76 (-) comp14159_c0_seq2:2627-2854(-)